MHACFNHLQISCRPLPPKASEFFSLATPYFLSISDKKCQFHLTLVLDLAPWRSAHIFSNAYKNVAMFKWINFAGVQGSSGGLQVPPRTVGKDSDVGLPGIPLCSCQDLQR